MCKKWIYSEMKIHKYVVIVICSLFLPIEGVTLNKSVQDGETFIFHLLDVESNGSDINSVEWKQTDKNKLLAIIKLQNDSIMKIHQDSRFQFMQNGSISITEVKQEDTGTYTCKIIYKNGTIKQHNISLTLSSENPEKSRTANSTSPSSEKTEETFTANYTSPSPDTQTINILQVVIVVSALGGLILLVVVILICLKCRRKRSTHDHIYMNYEGHKENSRKCKNKVTCDQMEIKS